MKNPPTPIRKLASLLEIPGASNRITPMEGMRGYAVLLVFLVHHHTLFGQFLPKSAVLYQFSQFGHDIGHSGVDLFFVLSGFLIYGHVFKKAPAYLPYLKKRMRRIYPCFLFIFCLYLLGSFALPSLSKLPRGAFDGTIYVLENLLLIPGIFPVEPMITVTWSISYEFFFYLTVPLLITVTRMRGWRRPARMVFFLGLLLGHCAGCYFGIVPHVRLTLFIAGILVYELIEAGWTNGRLSRRGEFLAIALYAAALLALSLFELDKNRIALNPHFPNRAFIYWPLFLCVGLFGLTTYTIAFQGVLRWIFSLTPLRWLGNMSYTYFLCHGLVLNGIAMALHRIPMPATLSAPAFVLFLLLNLLLTLTVSLAFFLLVEKPFSLAIKPVDDARKPQPSAGPSDAYQNLTELPARARSAAESQ